MHKSYRSRLFQSAWLLLVGTLAAHADDAKKAEKPDVSIVPARASGNVFGDAESAFRYRVGANRAIKGRVTWRLASGTATIKAGEVPLAVGPDAPADIAIKIPIPPLKDGVILPTKLSLFIIEEKQTKASATFEQDVWIFPKSAFADRTEWLKKLKITLYDPKGATEKLFTAEKIPFELARGLNDIGDLKEGILIVGEGIALDDEKGLGVALKKAAESGLTVLCLAPASGELPIPGLASAEDFEELTFRKDIVRKLDKRLDADGWPPDGKAIASTLTVKKGDDSAVGEVAAGAGGWPWVEARSGKGRWAVCGLAIVAKWDAGPTPRFLFARMLEYMTDTKMEPPKENDR